ncbi:MAG TPA: FlgD immunoglobulin-like domain containing protein [Candidatus Eisenbacteria bacterium]
MANRILLSLCSLCFGLAASVASASTDGSGAAASAAPPLDRGVVREQIPVFSVPDPNGLRTRRPHLAAPPLEEVVVFQDSLNALTINNQGGWTHVDNSERPTAWHLDTFMGCQGTSWWCGRIDSSWIYDTNRAGYENSWTQYLSNSVWLDSIPKNSTVRISWRQRFNAEPNYDYGYFEVYDIDEGWTPLATLTGKVPNSGACDTFAVTLPDSIRAKYYLNPPPGSHPVVGFRFTFTSDVAYSSEDGLYNGDGWFIDNITVKAGTQLRFFDDCDHGPGTWVASIFPPVGDYYSIASNVFTEDVCTTNRTNVWTDWDPVSQSVVPRMDNLLHTPPVFINRASDVFAAFDVYRNLPLYACYYYHVRFRTRNAGDPDWSEWTDPTRLLYYGSTKDWARQKVPLPGAAGKDSVQFELGLTDYSTIYCEGQSTPGGVYTFFDNVAIGVVADAPPLILQRDIDLFNDTFHTTAFFKDDNFNTPLGDSSAVEVSTSRGYKSGFMYYRFNGGSWNTTPLLPSTPALPRMRYADVPPIVYPSNTTMEYYFAATDSLDETAYLPAGAFTDGTYFSASILPVKMPTNPALGCTDSLSTILYVDNFLNREDRNYWAEALAGLGYKFDEWDVNAPSSGIGNTPGGSASTDPYNWPGESVNTLLQYSTIVWHAGDLSQFSLRASDQALLQGWIQQSGKNRNLLIAGDNVAYDLIINGADYNAFLAFTAGAQYLRDVWESVPQDSLVPLVRGVLGGPAAGRSFHVNGDCPIIDRFDLIGLSNYATGSGSRSGTLLTYPNSYAAAIRYARKYVSFGSDSARSVTMGFTFGDVVEGGERLLLARAILQDYFHEAACYTPSAVEGDPASEAPSIRNSLLQNAPNPFNPSTTIRYSIAAPGKVTIRVFNAGGALVRTLIDAPHAPGDYHVQWDGRDDAGGRLGSGVYFYRIETSTGFHDAKKLILLK